MLKLTESKRRGIRTLYQAVIAMLTVVPVLLALLPDGSPLAVQLGGIAAAVAAVSTLINKLEDAGLIPAWLKAQPAVEVDSQIHFE